MNKNHRLSPILALSAAFLMAAGTSTSAASRRTAAPVHHYTRQISIVADWIKGLQYKDPRLPSYGAIKIHHTAALTAPDGLRYYRVVPYFSSVAVIGLLKTRTPGALPVAERWIDWYLAHRNVDGTVYDRWYLADGTGETTAPAGLAKDFQDHEDASDSNAAAILMIGQDYLEAGGKRAFLLANGRKAKLEALAKVVTGLQQSNGLTWARNVYRVEYTMDNCEAYAGLHALALLESGVYHDDRAARRYELAAERIKQGLKTTLLDQSTRLYKVAAFENGSTQASKLTTWYPDTIAQVWPGLMGVVPPHSAQAKQSMAALNKAWPQWSHSFVDPGGFPGSMIACAAIDTGDLVDARAHTDLVCARKMPSTTDPVGFAPPFVVSDAGWLLIALYELDRH